MVELFCDPGGDTPEEKRVHMQGALMFLKETDGVLKMEDVLPFFPDFVLIDDFKEAICTSLEEYNRQIGKP